MRRLAPCVVAAALQCSLAQEALASSNGGELQGLRSFKVHVAMWDESKVPAFETDPWLALESRTAEDIRKLLAAEGFRVTVTPPGDSHPTLDAFEVYVRLRGEDPPGADPAFGFALTCFYREEVALKRRPGVSVPEGAPVWLVSDVGLARKSALSSAIYDQALECAKAFAAALVFNNGGEMKREGLRKGRRTTR